MKTYIAAIAALPLIISLSAQAANSTEEIMVTASRVEQDLSSTLPTAHVITLQDIERAQAADLPQLLDRISGIGYRNSGSRGSVSGIFIRGASSSQVLVLVDGVRTASATTGQAALDIIPIESIERIEVVKGSMSGLYGADALGGVIQIFTKKGSADGLSGGVRGTTGSNSFESYSAYLGGGNDQYQFFVNLANENTRGIDSTDIKTGGNQDRDGFEQSSGNLSLDISFSDDFNAHLSYLKSDTSSEFDNTFGADSGYFSDSDLESFSARLHYRATDNLNVTIDAGYLSDHIVTPVFVSDIQTRHRSLGLKVDYRPAENNLLVFGFDYNEDDVDTLNAFTETGRDNEAYYAQWQSSYGRVSLVTNLRYDDNEAYGDDTNGSLVLGYEFENGVKLVGSYGTAFRAPTFNDLYFPNFGNPDVLPEEAEALELSITGEYQGGLWRASAYRSEIDNLIGFDLFTFTADNTSEATLQGMELEYSRGFGQWSLSTNLEYLDAKDDNTDEYLDGRALWAANFDVGRDFGRFYISADIKAERGRHDRNGERLSGFADVGFSAVYSLSENLIVSARVDNLFNKDYTLNLASATAVYETEGLAAEMSVEYKFQ